MIKKIFTILFLFSVSFALVIGLYIYSTKEAYGKNGFERSFFRNKAIYESQINLDNDRYTFLEIKSEKISMFNYKKPYILLDISIDLKKRKEYHLQFPTSESKIAGRNTISFNGTDSFFMNGKTSTVYKLTTSGKGLTSSKLDSSYIYQSSVINPNGFVYVSIAPFEGIKRRILKKTNWYGQELATFFPETQNDGVFSTDGYFTYNEKSKIFIYMYYYRGKFTCLDTNLKVIYSAKTIDTIRYSKFLFERKPTKVKGKNATAIVTANQPEIVNKLMCVYDGKVYIKSNIKADNENTSEFNSSDVIDIYDIKDGQYFSSFYLPKTIGKQRLTEFRIYNDKLYGLYRHNLLLFKIPNK